MTGLRNLRIGENNMAEIPMETPREEIARLKMYLKAIIKTFSNNVEFDARRLDEVADDKIIITELEKYGLKYIRLQTVNKTTSLEID